MLGYEAKHAKPNTTQEEPVYDPSAKIVIKAGEGVSVISADTVTWLNTLRQTNNSTIIDYTNRIDSVKSYLNENYDDLELHADEIAELLGIELSNTVEFSITATFNVTVELERGQDPSEIDSYDFSFDVDSSCHEITDYDTTAVCIDDYNEV